MNGLRVRKDMSLLGGADYYDGEDLSIIDIQKKYKNLGDVAPIIKKSVFAKYPFPDIPGERYCPESVQMLNIAKAGYKYKWCRKPLMVSDYLEDGYTRNAYESTRNNLRYMALYYNAYVDVGLMDEKNRVSFVRLYYEQGKSREFSDVEILGMLGAHEKIYFDIAKDYYEKILLQIKKYIVSNNVRDCAIYGAGFNGHRIYYLMRKVGVEVRYFIDKGKTKDIIKTLQPSDNLPSVDLLFISLVNGAENVRLKLESKDFFKKIVMSCDIDNFIL